MKQVPDFNKEQRDKHGPKVESFEPEEKRSLYSPRQVQI